jgi:hypothetical protein
MGKAFEEYKKMKEVRIKTELEAKHALKRMRAAQFEAEHIFNKKVNELIDLVGLMSTLIDFLKEFYEECNGYYDYIYFVGSFEPAYYYISFCKVFLRVSDNQYIDVLGLTSEEQKQLKEELPMYKFE